MSTYLRAKTRLRLPSGITALVFAVVGIIMSLTISYEKLHLALNPDYRTSCSFNPIVSCSPVMQSWQAGLFWGFPNPFIGIVGFSVLAGILFVSLFVAIPRWVWLVTVIGNLSALVFCFWLASQALFVIQAICVYCVATWVSTSFVFWLTAQTALTDTRNEHYASLLKLGTILTVGTFGFLLFFAFHEYWLSLL